MALKKTAIELIAKLLKTDATALETAIKAEAETDITIDDTLQVLTPAELSARDEVYRKQGEETGKDIGKELATKTFKVKLGINDASKDPEVIATKAVEKLSGDDAIKTQVTLLQGDLTAKEKEIARLNKEREAANRDVQLITKLPTNRTALFNTEEHLNAVKTNLKFTEQGVEYKGQILRNPTTHAALTEDEAIAHLYKERKWIEETPTPGAAGGRGGTNNNPGAKAKTLGEWRTQWKAANPDKSFAEESIALRNELKENPDMEMSVAD